MASDELPESWKLAIIIPILKAKKTPHDLENYRPIALTSCVGKLFERCVYNRLLWYIDNHLSLNLNNCFAFRKNISSEDCVAHIAREAKLAQTLHQHLLFASIDIENAYPSTQHLLILDQLTCPAVGINENSSRCLKYIARFLQNNKIRVSCNGHLSPIIPLGTRGLPQGAILSPLLFNIALTGVNLNRNDEKCFVQVLSYADDIIVLMRDSGRKPPPLEKLENTCQQIIYSLHDKGFSVARHKMAIMHLVSQKVKNPRCHMETEQQQQQQSSSDSESESDSANETYNIRLKIPPPHTTFPNTHAPRPSTSDSDDDFIYLHTKKSHILLGIHLDEGLKFDVHLNNIKHQTRTWLNFIKHLCGPPFNTRPHILLNIYKSAVRPRIEFGSVAHSLIASKKTLEKLEVVQNNFLRTCISACPTTPIAHLQNEAGIEPISIRRKGRAIKHVAKLLAMRSAHPSYETVRYQHTTISTLHKINVLLHDWLIQSYLRNPQATLSEFNINPLLIESWPSVISTFCSDSDYKNGSMVPWHLNLHIFIDTILAQDYHRGENISNTQIIMRFTEFVLEKYFNCHFFYTDGSRMIVTSPQSDHERVSVTYAIYDAENKETVTIQQLTEHHTVFTAELSAIYHALVHIYKTKRFKDNTKRICIATDSLSACQLLQQPYASIISSTTSASKTNKQLPYAINMLHAKIMRERNLEIFIIWIPAHVGIYGNEMADKLANDGHSSVTEYDSDSADPLKLHLKSIPYPDINTFLRSKQRTLSVMAWKHFAEERRHRKTDPQLLVIFKNKFERLVAFDQMPKYKQKILARLRMEHTSLVTTIIYDPNNEDIKKCPKCKNDEFTVFHMLEKCQSTVEPRQRMNISIRKLFMTETEGNHIIQFLTETEQLEDI